MKQTSYKVKIIGILWCGDKAIHYKMVDTKPIDIQSLEKDFGDFQEITDYEVTEITSEYKWEGKKYISIETREVIVEFANDDSLDFVSAYEE